MNISCCLGKGGMKPKGGFSPLFFFVNIFILPIVRNKKCITFADVINKTNVEQIFFIVRNKIKYYICNVKTLCGIETADQKSAFFVSHKENEGVRVWVNSNEPKGEHNDLDNTDCAFCVG